MSSIALVDCNNFFVSCERLFNPKLHKIPVVVLSNNDGCIIARSEEAKALGIPMGAPLFEWRELIERKGVHTTSSNFALYGDLSNRVMCTLASCTPQLEIYSIDEAFLTLGKTPYEEGVEIRKRIGQWVGIPVSVGIAPTKTLAKLANYYAKKYPKLQGVFAPTQEEWKKILEMSPVGEVWGIGRRLATKLAKEGVYTCAELCAKSDSWIRRRLSVLGVRTVWELRGTPAIDFMEGEVSKQSIMSSRSFGHPVHALSHLEESVATHAARASEKMRAQKSQARGLMIYLRSKERLGETAFVRLPVATDYGPKLIAAAKKLVHTLYNKELTYKKAGVLLSGLTPKESFQFDLFHTPVSEKCDRFQQAIDTLNERYGKETAFFAAQGTQRSWRTKRNLCSQGFTTKWDELLTIQI